MKHKKWLMMLLTACIAFSAWGFSSCNNGAGGESSSSVAETTGNTLTLSANAKTLDRYETFTLNVTIKDADGKKVNEKVVWTSSNNAVATVEGGVVVAQGVGETTITATADTLSKTCVVTVEDSGAVPVLALEEEEISVLIDTNYEMGASVLYKRMEQSDATYTYEVSDTDIATVDTNGTITAKKCGETTVKVKASWRGVQSTTLTQTAKLIVKENIILNLSADKTTLATANTTIEGTKYFNSVALGVEFLKNEVVQTLDDSKCTWSSSEESVARVDKNGLVTAAGEEGETDISLVYTTDTGVYYSNVITIIVNVPTIDKTDSIEVDLDANADTIADCLTAESVFGVGTTQTITSVRANIDLSSDIYNDDTWLAEKDQGDEEERTYTLKVYNESYAYLIKAFVATKVITTAAELQSLQSYTTVKTGTNSKNVPYYSYGGYFVLANNLTATGNESVFGANSIGSISSGSDMQKTYGFHGIFDGRGYTVDGFQYGLGGVFGDIGDNAVIKNVAFINATVGVGSRQNGVGLLSANACGNYLISNVYVQGSLWGAHCGILLGRSLNGGTFENIVIDMTINNGTNATGDDTYTVGSLAGMDGGSNETFTNVTVVYGNADIDVKQSKSVGYYANSTHAITEYQKQTDGTIKKITEKTGDASVVTGLTLASVAATAEEFAGYDSTYWNVSAGYAPVFKSKI